MNYSGNEMDIGKWFHGAAAYQFIWMTMSPPATMNYVTEVSSNNRVKNLRNVLRNSLRIKKYDNLIDALSVSKIVRKLSGIQVLELVNTNNGIMRQFSLLGFSFFVLWYTLYFYCAFQANVEDQTILRNIYNTTVQRYGDISEQVISVVYVMLAMWKIPFSLSGNKYLMQLMIDADKALEDLGENIDYNKDAFTASVISVGQLVIFLIRILCIWLTLNHINVVMPSERMYQVVFSDSLALIVTAFYCYSLVVLRLRYRYANKLLLEISTDKSWEYKLFVRGRMPSNVQKAGSIQDKYLSDKIKACARIYSILYKAVMAINETFGLILVTTMLVSLIYLILYIFYFMVATAAGLFHDPTKYIDFTMYVFWQAAYAITVLYLIVYFCECLMREAKETSFILHQIMTSDLSPLVTNEAMQLSLQLLHQKPILTAYGLYKLNYALFEQGARSASTYIVILMQFVNDANLT